VTWRDDTLFVAKQLRDLAGLCARAAGLLFHRLGRVAVLGNAAVEATKSARGWPAENAFGALLPFSPLLALPPRWLRVWLPADVGSRDSVELDSDAGVDCNVDKRPVQLTKTTPRRSDAPIRLDPGRFLGIRCTGRCALHCARRFACSHGT
jgi:hypothetical protein